MLRQRSPLDGDHHQTVPRVVPTASVKAQLPTFSISFTCATIKPIHPGSLCSAVAFPLALLSHLFRTKECLLGYVTASSLVRDEFFFLSLFVVLVRFAYDFAYDFASQQHYVLSVSVFPFCEPTAPSCLRHCIDCSVFQRRPLTKLASQAGLSLRYLVDDSFLAIFDSPYLNLRACSRSPSSRSHLRGGTHFSHRRQNYPLIGTLCSY